jgi:hypothetical protein
MNVNLTSIHQGIIQRPPLEGSFAIQTADSREIVRITSSGEVVVNPEFTTSEAARAFWRAVQELSHRDLKSAASELYESLHDKLLWLRHWLTQVKGQRTTDRDGNTTNTFAAAVIPDWEIRQKVAEMEELFSK